MLKLCYPAIAVMNRLRYAQKFILITVLFTAPLLLLLILLVSDIDNGISVAHREQDGTRYLKVLRLLRQHLPELLLQEHMYASGLTPTLNDLNRTQSQVEEDLQKLLEVDRNLGLEMETAGQVEAINQTYQAIKQRLANHQYAALPNNTAASGGSSEDVYSQLQSQLQTLMIQVGDHSALVLDPDLATYYTITTILDKLPQAQDLLTQARALGQAVTNRRVITQSERSQLLVQVGLLRANNEELKKGLEVAFSQKPVLKPELTAALTDTLDSTANLSQQIQQEITNATLLKLKPDAYTATANTAITSTFSLWDATANSLDKLLQERQANFAQKKAFMIGIALLVVLLVSYFLVGFYLSVRRTVKRLALAAQQMVDGNSKEQLLGLDNADELGEVVRSFNQIASALISTGAQLQLRHNSSEQISQQVLALASELKLTASQQASNNTEQLETVTQVNTAANASFLAAQQVAQLSQQVSDAVNRATAASAQIKTTTSRAAQQSERGLEAVRQTVEQSREGESFYKHLLETMQELSAKGNSTRGILELISGLAAETHLLALNASIEAAGAGEYGQRFNVIAQEVKNLANRSAASSRDVVKVIQEMEQGLTTTMELASDGYSKAQGIAGKANLAGEVIQELLAISLQSQAQAVTIDQATEQVGELIELIQEAALEQHQAGQNLLNGFSSLSKVARQNAEGSQLVSTTAITLEKVSHTLTNALTNSSKIWLN
jgi:methyl-accepting chemotaxis protein